MFYIPYVDISSTKQMWNFLKNHPTYSVYNSWNGICSIAHNVKLYNLNLSGDWTTAISFLHDEADCGGLQIQLKDMLQDFMDEHPGCEVAFNGRSGGYLVLSYTKAPHNVLPECVACYDTYEEFKRYGHLEGYGTLKDIFYELREATQLVREFDKLCDRMRDLVDEFSQLCYEDFVLDFAVENFNFHYADDLKTLKFAPLKVVNHRVNISDVSKLDCLFRAFKEEFGYNRLRLCTEGDELFIE